MPPGRTNERDPWPSYKIYPSLVAASKRDHTSFILFALDLPRTTQDLVLPSVGLGVCTVLASESDLKHRSEFSKTDKLITVYQLTRALVYS